MLKQIVSFQKLLLMDNFQFNVTKPDVDKSKNSGYKVDFAVYVMLIFSVLAIFMCDTSFGNLVYWPMLFGLISLKALNTKGTGLLLKTLPVKNNFVVANLIMIYPIIVIAFWSVMLAFVTGGYVIETVIRIAKSIFSSCPLKFPEFYLFNSMTDIKIWIFALFAGLCIFTLVLTIYFVRAKWLKVTLAAIVTAVVVAPVVYFRFLAGKAFDDFTPIASWVNKLSAGSYCASLLIICAAFALFYALCVRLYARYE